MRIRKSTIALAAIALLAAGCSGGGNAANTTAPTFTTTDATSPTTPATSTTTTSTSTSTTSTTSTTTTPLTVTTPSTAPGPSIGGPVDSEDWVVTIQSLLDTRYALNGAPDPTRAGEVYFAGSPPGQAFQEQLTNNARDGLRVVDQDQQQVLSAEMTFYGPDSGDGVENAVVRVKLKVGVRLGRLVDSSGTTVFEFVSDSTLPPDGIVTVQYGLVRLNKAVWLIANEGSVG